MRDPVLGHVINNNPIRLARPKAPKAYQTESSKALDDEQLRALVNVVRRKAATGDVVTKRDLAILLFFLVTGMRRSEVINLRGGDLERRAEMLIIRGKVKGGDYVGREVRDTRLREALYEYLESCGRLKALEANNPLWTRHDRAGKPGAHLTSHAFVHNLKRYALEAGIEKIHVHQTRHTYARMVA
jgi:integrase